MAFGSTPGGNGGTNFSKPMFRGIRMSVVEKRGVFNTLRRVWQQKQRCAAAFWVDGPSIETRLTIEQVTELMNTRTKCISFWVVLCIIGTSVVACIINGTHVCAPKGSTVDGPLAHCITRSGEEKDLPSYVYTLAADCTTPWACLTFGAGYWDYSEGKTSCVVPINIATLMADCSYFTTPGGGTITITDCPKRSPTGAEDCPAIEPPPPGGGTWCLRGDSNMSGS